MSALDIAVLVLIVGAFVVFAGTFARVSIWRD
jgi:hypothetical protein